MHALIVGERGVGKSTLIGRVLDALGRPVVGFETKKEDSLADELRGSPVYIYEARRERVRTPENLVGYCKDHHFAASAEAFDRFAPRLRRPVPPGSVVLLDELGFMESQAAEFCAAVLALLDGDAPVLAAVKTKDTPFLEAVRSHPRARCFFITPENRDALYPQVLEFVRAQVDGADRRCADEGAPGG